MTYLEKRSDVSRSSALHRIGVSASAWPNTEKRSDVSLTIRAVAWAVLWPVLAFAVTLGVVVAVALLVVPGRARAAPDGPPIPAPARLANCLVVGDSIAVALATIGLRECRQCAKGGLNSWQINRLCSGPQHAHVVVVSMGTNDHSGIDSLKEVLALRRRIEAQHVVWIEPYFSHVSIDQLRASIRYTANEFGDWIVGTSLRENTRGIHPSSAGYRALAEQVREIAQ